MSLMPQGTTSAVRERALELLGMGVSTEQAASALGVTPARISQLMAEEEFATKVSELRYQKLAGNSERDSELDTLEDKLIHKINQLLPLVMKPLEAARLLQTVNGAKRRGAQGFSGTSGVQNVVQITMPTVITQKFVTNIQNQVVQAGEQQLLTIQSGTLLKNIQAENPEVVKSFQENAQTRTYNSEAQNVSSSQETSPASNNLPRASLEETLGSQQVESRVPAKISFIPVGS